MDATAADDVKGLANIKKVVVLMFENRSFDHVFGDFPGANGMMRDGKINREYYNLPNPLQPASDPSNLPVYPTAIDPRLPLNRDFTHDFGDGMMPSLFGPIFKTDPSPTMPSTNSKYISGYANGAPTDQANSGQKTYPETCSGFYTTFNKTVQQGQAALQYFEHDALKVLPALAKSFVLCDNWHCDMPGHTKANRLFMHCGTTGNLGIDDTDDGNCDAATIFNRIDDVPSAAWKMYAQVVEQNGTQNYYMPDTRFLREQSHSPTPIWEFEKDCNDGKLPFYSFIMCWLPNSTPWTDTSMHPGSLLQGGENLLAAVYNTLRNSPSWGETLLVVTFDENGGLYDHVMPPTTTSPGKAGIVRETSIGDCDNKWTLVSQFDFSLLGPRIPALLISPWLKAGIDSHRYQNTSVLRLLIDKLNSEFGKNVQPLSERDKTAPNLASAFRQFGTDLPRDDCPGWIEPYARLPSIDPDTNSDKIPYSDGKLGPWEPPPETSASPPPCHTREVLGIYVSPLPGHADTGKPITRTFATNADVANYVQERVEAAERVQRASSL